MDLRKIYYLTTNQVYGNYSQLCSQNTLANDNQNLYVLFNNMLLDRVVEAIKSGDKFEIEIIDAFLILCSAFFESPENTLKDLVLTGRQSSRAVDNFLYKHYKCSEIFDLYNMSNNINPDPMDDSFSSVFYNLISESFIQNKVKEKIKLIAGRYGDEEYKIFCDAVLEPLLLNEDLLLDQTLKLLASKGMTSHSILEMYKIMLSNYPQNLLEKYQQSCKDYRSIMSGIVSSKNSTKKCKDYKETDILIKPKKETTKSKQETKTNNNSITEKQFLKFKKQINGVFNNIVGQREQLKEILGLLYSNALGFTGKQGPRASIFLTGPTGVGKTETAYAISQSLYKAEPFNCDLSTMGEGHQLSTLIGAPPGYMGFDKPVPLLEYIKRNKDGGVLLFDEFDKANPEVLNIFMRMLDKGEIQTAKGEIVSVKNFIVITTSNVTEKLNRTIGFGSKNSNIKDNIVQKNTSLNIPPELLARFDLVVAYDKLSTEDKIELAKRKMKALCKRIETANDFMKIKIVYDNSIFEELAKSVNDNMGIRELFRDVNKLVTSKLNEYLMTNNNYKKIKVKIKSKDNITVESVK